MFVRDEALLPNPSFESEVHSITSHPLQDGKLRHHSTAVCLTSNAKVAVSEIIKLGQFVGAPVHARAYPGKAGTIKYLAVVLVVACTGYVIGREKRVQLLTAIAGAVLLNGVLRRWRRSTTPGAASSLAADLELANRYDRYAG